MIQLSNYEEYLQKKIYTLRKENNLTQDQMASELGLSYQAVSKWENGAACPDIMILPQLADMFNISIDELFREKKIINQWNETEETEDDSEYTEINGDHDKIKLVNEVFESKERPVSDGASSEEDYLWPDDETYRLVIYKGHQFVDVKDKIYGKVTVRIEEPLANVDCYMSIQCDEIMKDAKAGGSITCDEVYGNVTAGGSVTCDEVRGSVMAGGSITCDEIAGNAEAGSTITCDEVSGSVTAGVSVQCDEVGGNVTSGGTVSCDHIEGHVYGNVHKR